jgi:outer membrane protein insertion porin family
MRLQRLIAVLAVAAASVPGSGAAGESARVALLPIAVHSADREPGYLSAGLAEMLTSRLEQDGEISVIRLETDAVATNSRVALDLGRPSGADFVLYGSFTQFGEGASLDVRVVPTNGSRPEGERRIFIQSGTVAEIIPQLSVLAEKVKRYVNNDESPESPLPASVSVGPSTPAFDPDYESMLRRIDALEKSLYERVAKEAEQAAAEDEEVAEADPDPFNTGVPLR